MAMFAERIRGETPELHDEGVRMRFIGRREGVAPALRRADGLGRGADRRQRADHAVRRVQLRRPRGDPRRGRALEGGGEEEFRSAALRAGDARPRPHHPHERRAAALATTCCGSRRTPSSSSRDELWPDFSREAFEAALTSTRAPAALRGPLMRRGRRSSGASATARAGRGAARGGARNQRSDLGARVAGRDPRGRPRDRHRRARRRRSSRSASSCSA